MKTLKVRKIGASLIVTIPKDICELFHIEEGTNLELEVMGSDTLRLKVK